MTELHLTDEQLSSHIDRTGSGAHIEPQIGADRPLVDEHLRMCDACRARLVMFEEVRGLIGQPVAPVSSEVRAAAVASALQEGTVASVRESGGDEDRGRPAAVEGRGARLEPPTPVRLPGRARPRVVAGIAAALVLAGGIGAALSLGRSSSSNSATTGAARSMASAGYPPSNIQHGSTGEPGFVGDLGAVGSSVQLQLRLSPSNDRLKQSSASSSAGAALGSPGFSTQGPANSAGAGGTALSHVAACLSTAVHATNGSRTLELTATANYRSTPAVVFLFGAVSGATQGSAGRSLAVVTAAAGCRVLVTTSL